MSKPYRDPFLGKKPPVDPLAEFRGHALTLAAAARNAGNQAIVLAGRPSTGHRDKLALEAIAAKAGDLQMLLTMFGRKVMAALSKILRSVEGGRLMFWCPGCEEAHAVTVGEGPRPRWGYNGDPEKPTFTPSILVSGSDFTEKGRADYEAWCAAGCPKRDGAGFESRPTVCHSFVKDGRFQFLGDCTHALAGQTVDIPEFDA